LIHPGDRRGYLSSHRLFQIQGIAVTDSYPEENAATENKDPKRSLGWVVMSLSNQKNMTSFFVCDSKLKSTIF
jgi:hypothetical protein